MRTFYITCCVLLIVAVSVAENAPRSIRRSITVVSSQEAKGHVEADRLAECIWLLMRDQGLQREALPPILVVHVSKAEAEALGIGKRASVHFDKAERASQDFYQVWLVDHATLTESALAFQTVLQHRFALQKSGTDQRLLADRVSRVVESKISVRELAGKR